MSNLQLGSKYKTPDTFLQMYRTTFKHKSNTNESLDSIMYLFIFMLT